MPTTRTRTRRERNNRGYAALSEARRYYLWYGIDMFDGLTADWTDDIEIKKCWELHRENILTDWQREKNNAGRRPWGYWKFDKGIEKMPEVAPWQHPNQLKLLSEWGELSIEEKEIINANQ